ncbi:hypothetical protein ABPG74_019901 [Tetrahymena malaccensis]
MKTKLLKRYQKEMLRMVSNDWIKVEFNLIIYYQMIILLSLLQVLMVVQIISSFSANGKYLAKVSEDNTCKIWNVDKGFQLINAIQGHFSRITSVAFSADGKYLSTGSEDKTCKIWNTYLTTGSSWDKNCKILNVDKGFELINTIQLQTHWVKSVAFSADGVFRNRFF